MTNNFSPAIKPEPDDDDFFFSHVGRMSDSNLSPDRNAFASDQNGTYDGTYNEATPSLDVRSSNQLFKGSAGFGDQELLGSLFEPNHMSLAAPSNGMRHMTSFNNNYGQSAPDHFHGQRTQMSRGDVRYGQQIHALNHGLSHEDKKPPADSRFHRQAANGYVFQGINHASDPMFSSASDYGRAAPLPMSPRHPQVAALQQYGTSDSSSLGSLPMTNHRPRSSSGSNWGLSFDGETPLTSPMSVPKRRAFDPVDTQASAGLSRFKSNKQKAQSLPSGVHTKDEMKRIKRRQAHNMVEQKRRDKINDRIFELSHLVPSHRLDDSKVRRQQASHNRNASGTSNNDGPLDSAPLRRNGTAVQLTQAVSVEERDQTKGNALENAVKWTRDLMWLLERKIYQENVLIQTLSENNIELPYDIQDDDLRMAHELTLALAQNHDQDNPFVYSRHDGSGLYVPYYTDALGQKVTDELSSSADQSRQFKDAMPTAGGLERYSDPDSNGWTDSPALSDQYHFDAIDESPMEGMEL